MTDVKVSVKLTLMEEIPDGETCVLCHEVCWLKVFRVYVENVPTPVTVCQSCSEMY